MAGAASLLLKDADEALAYGPTLGFGLGQPTQGFEEGLAGVDRQQPDAQVAAERLRPPLRSAPSHQPGVNEDAGQLVSDGAMDAGSRHGRIAAATDAGQDAFVAN